MFPRVYSRYDRQAIKNRRLNIEGSPKFEVTISDLAADAEKLYGFSSDYDIRKFLPLNYLRIHNKGGARLKVYVGQKSNGEVVEDDTVWTSHGEFYNFKLENIDTGTATGSLIFVNVQRIPGGG